MRVVRLSDVSSIFNGKTPSKSDQRDAGFPVLKIKDVADNGRFRGNFESFVDEEYAGQYKEKLTRPGDTLILNAAHNSEYVGSKTHFVDCESTDALTTGEWLIVRPSQDMLHCAYANHLLNSPQLRFQIKNPRHGRRPRHQPQGLGDTEVW